MISELTITNHNGTLVADSRDVAEIIGKNHKELLRDIKNYIQIMEKKTGNPYRNRKPKIGLS